MSEAQEAKQAQALGEWCGKRDGREEFPPMKFEEMSSFLCQKEFDSKFRQKYQCNGQVYRVEQPGLLLAQVCSELKKE